MQCAILAIPAAPEHPRTALVNAFMRADKISDEALREAALRSLVPYWRAAAPARDGKCQPGWTVPVRPLHRGPSWLSC